jgi:hypothetical protein
VAERYGWINRALPDADLDAFVARLARRIASFPADAVRSAKRVLNELSLPGADAIRADARRFHQLVVSDTAQGRTAALFAQGLQTRGPLELDLGDRIGALDRNRSNARRLAAPPAGRMTRDLAGVLAGSKDGPNLAPGRCVSE